jgi:tRNA 2-thiouridine synthesizing protein A
MAFTGCCCLTTEPAIEDARGLKCPLPVLRMEKRLAALSAGARLVVLATDPIAKVDIPLYCIQQGHACVTSTVEGALRFEITKRADGPAA